MQSFVLESESEIITGRTDEMSMFSELLRRGPKESWVALAAELNGQYFEGSLLRPHKVVAKVSEWTITLDQYSVSSGQSAVLYTRIRAPLVLKSAFQFHIYEKSIFTSLSRFVGVKLVETGNPEIDYKYAVRSSHADSVKALLTDPAVAYLLEQTSISALDLRKGRKDELDEHPPLPFYVLSHEELGDEEEIDRLKLLFLLEAELLQRLNDLDQLP